VTPRLLAALIAALALTAVLGCARQQPAPGTAPAVSPPPKTGTTGPAEPAGKESPPASVATADEGQTLYDTKCTRCHTLDRVRKHDPAKESWPGLVASMQAKKAGWISDAEAATIVQHLDKAYPAK